MMGFSVRAVVWVVAIGTTVWLSGCSSKPKLAPIEERTPVTGFPAGIPVAPAPGQPEGFENAGKAGYYTVKPGDTMFRIGMETGQSWRDIARWNGLVNANVIEVGQVLLVTPPAPVPAAVPPAMVIGAVKPFGTASAPGLPPNPSGVMVAPVTRAGVTTTAVTPSAVTATAVPPTQGSPIPPVVEDEVSFKWPASGNVVGGFDGARNKGIDIAGAVGDSVLAAADGRVVYVGSALASYGNLIIVQHNSSYLTAYGHNQAVLVKELQTVRQGQKIAEMGNTGTDKVKLHFEVRRLGTAVDPAKYLPPR